MIGKRELGALLPHAGAMCLLDGVKAWDERSILCVATSHRDADNPLRSQGRLNAVHALEYGAQAAAVHGGLLARDAGKQPQFGYLAAFRDVCLRVAHLDTVEGLLEVTAERLMGNGGNQIYAARVAAGEQVLMTGRLIVITMLRERLRQ